MTPPPEAAIQRAVQILETENDEVIAGMMQLLHASRDGSTWRDKHTASALEIVSQHVQNQHLARLAEIDAQERISAQKQFPLLLILGALCAIGISWLFLCYGQPQYVAAVVTAVGGYAAGYGVARAAMKKAP